MDMATEEGRKGRTVADSKERGCLFEGLHADSVFLGLHQINSKTTSIDKYMYLSNLRNTNTDLFYRLLIDHMKVCLFSTVHNLRKSEVSDGFPRLPN